MTQRDKLGRVGDYSPYTIRFPANPVICPSLQLVQIYLIYNLGPCISSALTEEQYTITPCSLPESLFTPPLPSSSMYPHSGYGKASSAAKK